MIVTHRRARPNAREGTVSAYHLDANSLSELVTEELFGYGRMSARQVKQALWEGLRAIGRSRREGRLKESQARLMLEVLIGAYLEAKLVEALGRFGPFSVADPAWPPRLY